MGGTMSCMERPDDQRGERFTTSKESFRKTNILNEYRPTVDRYTVRASLKEDDMIAKKLLNQLKLYKQGHLLNHHRTIRHDEKAKLRLLEDIGMIDFATIDFFHHNFFKAKPLNEILIDENEHLQLEEITPDYNLGTMRKAHKKLCFQHGLKTIAEGKLAVIILASDFFPTDNGIDTIGTKPLDIPSKKSIMRIWIEKIKYLGSKALEEFGRLYKGARDPIPVYIMTSEKDNDAIYDAMEKENFYGYGTSYVFPQKDLPAFSQSGMILMRSMDQIGMFPNGDGGLFQGLRSFDLIKHLKEFGCEYTHIISATNIMGKPGDPSMLGLLQESGTRLALKTFNSKYYEGNFKGSHIGRDGVKLVAKATQNSNTTNFDLSTMSIETNRKNKAGYCYVVDCMLKTDFFEDKTFTRNFNFMERYRFVSKELEIFDPVSITKYSKTAYLAHIDFKEVFNYCYDYTIIEDSASEFFIINDEKTFKKACSMYLRRHREIIRDVFKEKDDFDVDECEISAELFYDEEDVDTFVLNNNSRVGNVVYFESM